MRSSLALLLLFGLSALVTSSELDETEEVHARCRQGKSYDHCGSHKVGYYFDQSKMACEVTKCYGNANLFETKKRCVLYCVQGKAKEETEKWDKWFADNRAKQARENERRRLERARRPTTTTLSPAQRRAKQLAARPLSRMGKEYLGWLEKISSGTPPFPTSADGSLVATTIQRRIWDQWFGKWKNNLQELARRCKREKELFHATGRTTKSIRTLLYLIDLVDDDRVDKTKNYNHAEDTLVAASKDVALWISLMQDGAPPYRFDRNRQPLAKPEVVAFYKAFRARWAGNKKTLRERLYRELQYHRQELKPMTMMDLFHHIDMDDRERAAL